MSDLEAVKALKNAYDALRAEMATVIVGQDQVLEEILIAIFAKGHCLLEGVPGLAKTLIISSLARCLDLSFKRIQFTPDLMPSDITGTEVIRTTAPPANASSASSKAPSSATSVSPTKSTARPPKTQAALPRSHAGKVRHGRRPAA